jgi:hypothetical protein
MGFSLMYGKALSSPSPSSQTYQVRYEAEGDVFYLEQDLVVFYDAAGAQGRPMSAANLADLLYISRDDAPASGAGFEVKGRFGEDDKATVLTAAGAETFFTERGFAVLNDDLARSGTQVLAVRCSEVDVIRPVSTP